jgi:TetR/AcrR family fatty acid metabolism transcriptional regulator
MVAAVKNTTRRRREETRERLMESAISVFARSGFERATVDEIVRDAGFSKGAFYVHFESKDDLFWAMLEDRISHQLESFRQAMDYDQPMTHNVRTILDAVFGLAREDPLWLPLFLEFGAHAAHNDKVRQRLATMYTHWRNLLIDILDVSQVAGRMRKDIDVKFIATVLIAAVEGCMIQSHVSPENVDLEEMTEPLAATLAEWLVPDPD